jgi:hypothetical protein
LCAHATSRSLAGLTPAVPLRKPSAGSRAENPNDHLSAEARRSLWLVPEATLASDSYRY